MEPIHFAEHKYNRSCTTPFCPLCSWKLQSHSPTSGLTHDIHQRLKCIPLQHRRALYDLALFYQIRSSMVNINFPPIVQPSSRQPDRYVHVQTLHSHAYKYNFFNSTIRTWNILPKQALSSANVTQFKAVTRNWITPLPWSKINSTWTLN